MTPVTVKQFNPDVHSLSDPQDASHVPGIGVVDVFVGVGVLVFVGVFVTVPFAANEMSPALR